MTVFQGRRELLDAFRKGERAALSEVYRAYVDDVAAVLRYGFSVESKGVVVPGLRDADREGELLQEVFLRAFSEHARQAYDGLSPYRPYLLRIAKNLLVDHGRRSQRLVLADPADLADLAEARLCEPHPEVEAELDRRPLREAVRDYCAGLQPRLRQFVELRFEDGMSQEAVAESLGLTRRKVRTLEDRVRKGARRLLRKRGLLG